MPIFELPNEIIFPNPELAEEDGLLAVGGDLSPERLLAAYSTGIFPWYSEESPILWWTLNPRLILLPKKAKFSKSLLKSVKNNEFEIRIDTCFQDVIEKCAFVKRKNQKETWITNDMINAYIKLHKLGYAHSFETFQNNKLVGGLYGVSIGKMFAGESMFHLVNNASKVAFYHLVAYIKKRNFNFIDCQQPTSHLISLGAQTVSRTLFLRLLSESMQHESIIGKWSI